MTKIIDYKKVDMTDLEFNYYKSLVKTFTDNNTGDTGDKYFKDAFEVDDDGFITLIKTEKNMPWSILFFLQQLMISQRLRFIDEMRKNGSLNGK